MFYGLEFSGQGVDAFQVVYDDTTHKSYCRKKTNNIWGEWSPMNVGISGNTVFDDLVFAGNIEFGNSIEVDGDVISTGVFRGDIIGNADTATYATTAGNATNATNATHATTADSATTCTGNISGSAGKVGHTIKLKNTTGTVQTFDGSANIDLTSGVNYAAEAGIATNIPNIRSNEVTVGNESATVGNSGTFIIPRITVDKQGRVSAVSASTIKISTSSSYSNYSEYGGISTS